MISIEEARRIISEAIAPLTTLNPDEEELINERVLMDDIRADADYPAWDCSMMDGYAIPADDPSPQFKVVMTIPAGQLSRDVIGPGECARIFTGAPLPHGAALVIPQEDVRREGDLMIPMRRSPRSFVRKLGSEARKGEIVLRRGTNLGAAEMAILAQVGVQKVNLLRTLYICHVVTGDELVDPTETPTEGEIRDSNSSLIEGLTFRDALCHSTRCRDDLPELVDACSAHLDREPWPPDILLISGGASVGEHDFGARALRELGFEIRFDRVNLRPGKPLTFAMRGTQAAFVIPGNPVSHFVCYHVAIRLALERLQGLEPAWCFVNVTLGGESPLRADARETFWPARVVVREGKLVALPRRWTSSGDTFSLAGTNALLRVTRDVQPGESVPALLLDVPAGS